MHRLDAGRPPPCASSPREPQGPAGPGADTAAQQPIQPGWPENSDTVVEAFRGWCARQPDKDKRLTQVDTFQQTELIALATEIADQPICVDTALLGHAMQSIQVVRLVQRARHELGLQLHPDMLIEHQTIGALVRALGETEVAEDVLSLASSRTDLLESNAKSSASTSSSSIIPSSPHHKAATSAKGNHPNLDLSILFFGSNLEHASSVYDLVVDASIFADQRSFKAAWLPERHFQQFGGSFPNPNPLAATLAKLTSRIRLRAGSVNCPQHANPLRIAEDWAVVDNLSGGRVDISFGAGWNVVDFALQPQNFLTNKVVLWESIQAVRTLWQGGKLQIQDGLGCPVTVQTRPQPVQPVLEVWVSAVINPQTFWDAGAIGANMLCSVFGQTWEELGQKTRFHRASLQYHGFDSAKRTATCLLHTLILGSDKEAAVVAKDHLIVYLLQNIHLVTLQYPELAELPEADLAKLAAERFIRTASLIGSVDTCLEMASTAHSVASISELACLIDFCTDSTNVMHSLSFVAQLKDLLAVRPNDRLVPSIKSEALLATHLFGSRQCGRPGQKGRPGSLESVERPAGTGCLVVKIAMHILPDYTPGQHVVLLNYGEDEAQYVFASLSSINQNEKTVQVVLRDGPWPPLVSLLPKLSRGADLRVDGGHGEMILPDQAELCDVEEVVLIGAGTGITGLRCLLAHMLQLKWFRPTIRVIYSWNVHKYPSVLFHNEFQELAQAGKITYVCMWTGVQQPVSTPNVSVFYRRIDSEVISAAITTPETALAFVCGMPFMVGEVLLRLQHKGVQSRQVRRETYGISPASGYMEERHLEDSAVSELPAFVASQVSTANKGSIEPLRLYSKGSIEPSQAEHSMRPTRILGTSCILAGGTNSPDRLWSTLLARDSHVTRSKSVPSRCRPARMPAGRVLAVSSLGSDLQAALTHSHGGFPADQVLQYDMHIQLLLDTSLRALTDAGLVRATLASQEMGVFTGSQPIDFITLCPSHMVARALASALKVSGPHQNLDMACSSGYLATHHAMQALQAGHCPAGALVSGASLLLKPDSALEHHAVGILSPSGRMRPFDMACDGTVFGEASGALVLLSEPPWSEAQSSVGRHKAIKANHSVHVTMQNQATVSEITSTLIKGRSGLGLTLSAGLVLKSFKDMPAGEPNPGKTAVPALELGDRVVAVDGVQVQTKKELQAQMAQTSNYMVKLTVRRSLSSTGERCCRLVASAANCNNALSPSGYVDRGLLQQVAEAALVEAGIGAERLTMCHPHAMGTRNADIPELAALLPTLTAGQRQHSLVLAGHKANFGHSVCAAGLISVMVSTLALQHRVVPVHLGVTNLLTILEKAKDRVLLPAEHPAKLDGRSGLCGSINGHSTSGDNVHLVLSQAANRQLQGCQQLVVSHKAPSQR